MVHYHAIPPWHTNATLSPIAHTINAICQSYYFSFYFLPIFFIHRKGLSNNFPRHETFAHIKQSITKPLMASSIYSHDCSSNNVQTQRGDLIYLSFFIMKCTKLQIIYDICKYLVIFKVSKTIFADIERLLLT
jgi:hypothetical protein